MKVVRQTFSDTHSSNLFFPWFSNKYFEVFQTIFCSLITFALKKLIHRFSRIHPVYYYFCKYLFSVFSVVNFLKLCKTLGRSSKPLGFVLDKS